MDFAAKGAAALQDKDFATALTSYTKALIDHPSSPDYFTQRSIAFTRISPPRHDLALKDAEYAVLLGQKRAKREKIQAGQQRRVVALHGLGRYADAKAVLETMERWTPKDSKPAKMEGDMWMARVENKLKAVSEEEKVPIEKEYPQIDLPSEAKMKTWLKSQLKTDGSFKYEGDVDMKDAETPSDAVASTSGMTNGNAKQAETTTTPSVVPAKIRHEWYQSPTAVTVTLYAKAVAKDKCEIDIQEDSVNISFPRPSDPSSTYSFTLDPLFALIDPFQSTGKVMSTKIELTLKKAQAGQKWHNLEGITPLKSTTNDAKDTVTADADDAAKAAIMSTLTKPSPPTQPSQPKETAPSYPTSSRTGPKNWDKLADDQLAKAKPKKKKSKSSKSKSEGDKDAGDASSGSEAEDDGYDSDLGGDAVDGFFKKLYAGADDDTRRAMMKSFYESNGTSLSTNWGDVGSRHVDEVRSKDD
ncbi:Cochaperone protein [Cladophialophora chaetospira]|uniref:Cochaperone protein n=1 Tax=Cladophialophora chaetospira TaxID=386627 RepID=A0AA38X130_9EURO|nr:Cochaperone protein [Cladophialophora chaetospira]